MTLIVTASRSQQYVLAITDSSAYEIDGDDPNDVGKPFAVTTPKTIRLSDRVIVSLGGCRIIGEEFRALIAGKISANADLDACDRAVRAVVTELAAIDADRTGLVLRKEDIDAAGLDFDLGPGIKEVTRCSISNHFSIVMNGFRSDGRTALIQCAEGTFDEYEDADGGEFLAGVPYGVDTDDVIAFYADAKGHDFASAFGHAFSVPHVLGRKYPDRITRDIHLAALIWRGDDPPTPIDITLDREDVDAFARIYATLEKTP